ncbi:MAG TPA: glycoside hydrolase family 66 protein [Bacillales bacterium]|nr:glycoside hydrolase family 66 protein [Bacillales bacterium]
MEPLHLIDIYPDKAQYRPQEKGAILLKVQSESETEVRLEATFLKLQYSVWAETITFSLKEGLNTVSFPFDIPSDKWEGYGVKIEIFEGDTQAGEGFTAFDVADHWKRAPRYGFLSGFSSGEKGKLADAEALNKFHLNVIQFYDWMYRHDDLIPPENEFIDPMGRTLSYPVVKEKIDALHQKGMAAMAYGAVYASLKDFHDQHPEWGLYTGDGKPLHLINIFYLMDISPDSPWVDNIIAEFKKAIEEGFDGIHMDQYGFPKKAVRYENGRKEWVNLAECYPALIDQAKSELEKVNESVGLIFNNVSNYPVHTTATADQEAVYIEVWPPVVHLRELKGLIDRGRELSAKKHVILSAYLPTFKKGDCVDPIPAENGALLTMATIFASGGFHLLLGEENNVLTEAYYPDYGRMRTDFVHEVRRYYDFIVYYGKLLYPFELNDVSMTYTGGINTEVQFKGDAAFSPNGDLDTVWIMVKQLDHFEIIHLINLVGLEDDFWDHVKRKRPREQEKIECQVLLEGKLKGIYLASPDFQSIRPINLSYEIIDHNHGKVAKFLIPQLFIWDMIYIEWERK